jgi:hypothetical protein
MRLYTQIPVPIAIAHLSKVMNIKICGSLGKLTLNASNIAFNTGSSITNLTNRADAVAIIHSSHSDALSIESIINRFIIAPYCKEVVYYG